jgi:hypothetical protein
MVPSILDSVMYVLSLGMILTLFATVIGLAVWLYAIVWRAIDWLR